MRKQSFDSVTIYSIDEGEVRRAVDAYVTGLLASHPEVEEVVVFGSFAKGTYAPGSDVDIFLLLSHSEKPIRDRIRALLPDRFPLGVDLFPYTREEVAARAGSALLADVARSTWRYQREQTRLRADGLESLDRIEEHRSSDSPH